MAMRSKATKAAAIEELREMGAECLKREDRFGETKSGWWLDGVWLAPTNDPVSALNSAKYGAN
jgi:isocitrate lyase